MPQGWPGSILGSILGAKMEPKSIQKSMQNSMKFGVRFLYGNSITKWSQNGGQNPLKIDEKSLKNPIGNLFIFLIVFQCFFTDLGEAWTLDFARRGSVFVRSGIFAIDPFF